MNQTNVMNETRYKLYKFQRGVGDKSRRIAAFWQSRESVIKVQNFLTKYPIAKKVLTIGARSAVVGVIFCGGAMAFADSAYADDSVAMTDEISQQSTEPTINMEQHAVEPSMAQADVQVADMASAGDMNQQEVYTEPVVTSDVDTASMEQQMVSEENVNSQEVQEEQQLNSETGVNVQEEQTNVNEEELKSNEELDEKDQETTLAAEKNSSEELGYLEPTYAIDGVDISDPSSLLGKYEFDSNVNTILLKNDDGSYTVIWCNDSYSNPNQQLLLDNLQNSEITNLDPNTEVKFVAAVSPDSTGFHSTSFDGGQVIFDPNTGKYTVITNKDVFGSVMGVETTTREFIDAELKDTFKPKEPTPEEPTPEEPTPEEPTPEEKQPEEKTETPAKGSGAPVEEKPASVLAQTGDNIGVEPFVVGTVVAGSVAGVANYKKMQSEKESLEELRKKLIWDELNKFYSENEKDLAEEMFARIVKMR